MKTYIYVLLNIFILHFFLFSCRDDEPYKDQVVAEQSVHIAMKVPGIGGMSTRAVEEYLISNMTVLVFEEAGGAYQFSYRTPGYSLAYLGDSIYEFYAKLTYTEEPIRLYLLANAPTVVNAILPGATEQSVRQLLTGSFSSEGFDGALPMFGELDFPGGVTEDINFVSTSVVRSVARVDVVNTATDFELATIQVYRASDRYQIIPNSMTGFIVDTPSIPAGTTQSVNTEQLPVTNNQSLEQVYVPESPMPAEANRRLEATVVVVGGVYGTDTDTTYYRMDFVPDDDPGLFGQILRNHRYRFNITNVSSSGWRTPDEAAESDPTQIEVEIVTWNETTTTMVFDDVRYFGVSTRVVNFGPSAGLRDTIIVETNVSDYQIYWSDQAGNIDEDTGPITLGQSFTDPDSLFTVTVSGDGSNIYFVTDSTNREESEFTRYLMVYADRLRLRLTINQERFRLINRALKVYSPASEIGRLGNQVFPGVSDEVGERVEGLRAFLSNTVNFGPSGVIPIEGVIIGGLVGGQITSVTAEMFDVLYFPYPAQPDANSIAAILNWLNANDKRVLIAHYDSQVTNRDLLVALGLPANSVTETTQTPPYTLSPDAPEIVTNGVFGNVPEDLAYRSYDDTHGRIPVTTATAAGIDPILLAADGSMLLGIDFDRRIVFAGDIDLYNSRSNARLGSYMTTTGIVGNNPANILIGNIWSWISTVVLSPD